MKNDFTIFSLITPPMWLGLGMAFVSGLARVSWFWLPVVAVAVCSALLARDLVLRKPGGPAVTDMLKRAAASTGAAALAATFAYVAGVSLSRVEMIFGVFAIGPVLWYVNSLEQRDRAEMENWRALWLRGENKTPLPEVSPKDKARRGWIGLLIFSGGFVLGYFLSARIFFALAGYPCTSDCSGHLAGYDWAEDNYVSERSECDSPSQSFREGCYVYLWVDK